MIGFEGTSQILRITLWVVLETNHSYIAQVSVTRSSHSHISDPNQA